jgi:hypothetical protein
MEQGGDREGRMPAGSPRDRATIVEIAAATVVSKFTVSLVPKGSESVRPGTWDSGECGHPRAGLCLQPWRGNLRRAHSHIVGMTIHDPINPVCAGLAVGIERKFSAPPRPSSG